MQVVTNYIGDFWELVYPQICFGCGRHLQKEESVICMNCRHFLPKTDFHNDPENPVFKLFWGRVPVAFAAAYLYFKKDSTVQQLLHQLKYKKRPEVGEKIGALYGEELLSDNHFSTVDYIVPVPLHPLKRRKRGFNQSAAFAEGLAEGLGVDWSEEVLYRTRHNPTQTRKKRFERWQNVASLFALDKAYLIRDKHVLLVDDVVTTGSTLESCAQTLLQVEGVKVSIATIAFATKV